MAERFRARMTLLVFVWLAAFALSATVALAPASADAWHPGKGKLITRSSLALHDGEGRLGDRWHKLESAYAAEIGLPDGFSIRARLALETFRPEVGDSDTRLGASEFFLRYHPKMPEGWTAAMSAGVTSLTASRFEDVAILQSGARPALRFSVGKSDLPYLSEGYALASFSVLTRLGSKEEFAAEFRLGGKAGNLARWSVGAETAERRGRFRDYSRTRFTVEAERPVSDRQAVSLAVATDIAGQNSGTETVLTLSLRTRY